MDEYDVRGRDERDRFLALVGRMDATFRSSVYDQMNGGGKEDG
jgi:hypothetical protein